MIPSRLVTASTLYILHFCPAFADLIVNLSVYIDLQANASLMRASASFTSALPNSIAFRDRG
jgi:hypothetical protein